MDPNKSELEEDEKEPEAVVPTNDGTAMDSPENPIAQPLPFSEGTVENELEFHPYADFFPLMELEELNKLVGDIQQHGLLEPITLYAGKILDGRNRYRACQRLKIQPVTRDYDGDAPVAFVIAKNLHRRHLTQSQLAAIALHLLQPYQEEARQRQRGVTPPGGVSQFHHPVLDEAGPGTAAEKLGRHIGVGHTTIEEARRVQEHRPDLLEKIKAGKLSTKSAVKLLRQGETTSSTASAPSAPTPVSTVEALPRGVTTASSDPKPMPWYWDKKIERSLFKLFGKASAAEKRQILARVEVWKSRMEKELYYEEHPLSRRES